MADTPRPLAVVTGASSGIGFELAKQCAEHGFDLVIVADQAAIEQAADDLSTLGTSVDPLQMDLATIDGIEALISQLRHLDRPIDALLANAGIGLGRGFLDQDMKDVMRVVDTNISGTLYLLHEVGLDMRARGRGRILITGSIAGLMPGTFQAVYSATKAFLDSFSVALRHELSGTGVSVTCLLPGATDTEFFERADMMDTKIGQDWHKADPADVAKTGFDAMMKGEESVIHGMKNRLCVAVAGVAPEGMLAELHRKQAEPGSASK
jgi:short-subunit dehydrogenase